MNKTKLVRVNEELLKKATEKSMTPGASIINFLLEQYLNGNVSSQSQTPTQSQPAIAQPVDLSDLKFDQAFFEKLFAWFLDSHVFFTGDMYSDLLWKLNVRTFVADYCNKSFCLWMEDFANWRCGNAYPFNKFAKKVREEPDPDNQDDDDDSTQF